MSDRFRVDTDKLGGEVQSFHQQAAELQRIAQRMISCKKQLQINSASAIAIRLQMERIYDQALADAAQMDTLAKALDSIIQTYTACEKGIVGNISGIAKGAAEGVAEQTKNTEPGTDKRSRWRKFWDWLWGKDVDTKYTHTTREQEAAADAYMQNRVQELYESDRFSEETWANASVKERKKILQDFMNEVAEILGVDVKSTFAPLNEAPSNGYITNGWYNHSKNAVAINMYIVENYSAARSYELLTTVVHELRHAYQYAAVDDPTKYQVSQETIDSWKESFDNYKNTDDFVEQGMNREDAYDAYRNQAVERDARWFAGQD